MQLHSSIFWTLAFVLVSSVGVFRCQAWPSVGLPVSLPIPSSACYWSSSQSCSSSSFVVLQNVTIPANTLLSISLTTGATLKIIGTITFLSGTLSSSNYLFTLTGSNVIVDGTQGTLYGMGEYYWDGQGTGGVPKPKFFKVKLSSNSHLYGITILNAPIMSFSVASSNTVIENVFVNNAAGDPRVVGTSKAGHNTDAFDVSSSSQLIIQNSIIYNQDDCLALNQGTDIRFINNTCIGGHGISIAAYDQNATNVLVDSCSIIDSQNGVRVKSKTADTTGTVSNIVYQNITLSNIQDYGIIIQQDYPADDGVAGTGTEFTGVTLTNIQGTVQSSGTQLRIICGNCNNFVFTNIAMTGGKTAVCTGLTPTPSQCATNGIPTVSPTTATPTISVATTTTPAITTTAAATTTVATTTVATTTVAATTSAATTAATTTVATASSTVTPTTAAVTTTASATTSGATTRSATTTTVATTTVATTTVAATTTSTVASTTPATTTATATTSIPTTSATTSFACSDVRPHTTPSHSCSLWSVWGDCNAAWMLSGRYCRKTCTKCSVAKGATSTGDDATACLADMDNACVSLWGLCGNTSDFCGVGCQAGACYSSPSSPSSTSSNAKVPALAQSLGCLSASVSAVTTSDGSTTTLFPISVGEAAEMTPLYCVQQAIVRALPFAALLNGIQCWGATSVSSLSSLNVSSSSCNVACGGDSTLVCGGSNAYSAWNISLVPAGGLTAADVSPDLTVLSSPSSSSSSSSSWDSVLTLPIIIGVAVAIGVLVIVLVSWLIYRVRAKRLKKQEMDFQRVGIAMTTV